MVTEKVRVSEYKISLVIIYSFVVDQLNENKEKISVKTLINSQRIQLSRSFVYDIARVNAMQKEEELIREEMRQEAAFRILHHVQAVSDTLEYQAYTKKELKLKDQINRTSANNAFLSHQ